MSDENSQMNDEDFALMNQRILVTEETKHALPEGYNWINSCPVIRGLTTCDRFVVYQIGYPNGFLISRDLILKMRRDFLATMGIKE